MLMLIVNVAGFTFDMQAIERLIRFEKPCLAWLSRDRYLGWLSGRGDASVSSSLTLLQISVCRAERRGVDSPPSRFPFRPPVSYGLTHSAFISLISSYLYSCEYILSGR